VTAKCYTYYIFSETVRAEMSYTVELLLFSSRALDPSFSVLRDPIESQDINWGENHVST
jgi:hypothetical protein